MHKFKVWCKVKEKWRTDLIYIDQEGNLYEYELDIAGNPELIKPEEYKIVWRTPWKDRNNNPIYENDIVEDTIGLKYVITFQKGGFRFHIVSKPKILPTGNVHNPAIEDMKIIGNIFQNQDLIVKKKVRLN
jgi:hypothetical protein